MKTQAPVYRDGKVIKSDWTVHQEELQHLKKIIVGLQNELIAQTELRSEIENLKRQVKDLTWEKQNLAHALNKKKPLPKPSLAQELKAADELQTTEEWKRGPDGVWRQYKKPTGRPKKS